MCREYGDALVRGCCRAVWCHAANAGSIRSVHVARSNRRNDRAAVQAAVDVRTCGQPPVGDLAPDFALPLMQSDRVVKLSEEIRERPVVLIFGSYT